MRNVQERGIGTLLAMTLAAPLAACSSIGMDESAEHFGQTSDEIRNGTVADPWHPESTAPRYARAIVDAAGCTGTVVQPSWVLSAKHCGFVPGATITSRRALPPNVQRTVDVVVPNEDPAGEAVMLHLSTPFTDMPTVQLYTGRTSEIFGQTARVWGYGAKAFTSVCSAASPTCPAGDACNTAWGLCMTPSTQLRYGDMLTEGFSGNADTFIAKKNALGQMALPGDSGGPGFLGTKLAGINWSGGDGSLLGSVPGNRELISVPSRVKYTVGDFDGNGMQDVIITTTTGSYWYYATSLGQWDTSYFRTDLPMHQVIFTPGNFNGDSKTDLIITTPTGSYWYYGKSVRGTWDVAQSRTDLPIGNGSPNTTPKYTIGDFNADGRSDYIVQTHTGSYWYYSNAQGTFDLSYTRTDLPTGVARFTAGKFDDNASTDLVITTPSGSFWYYSNGGAGWNVGLSRTDLPLGQVEFTPGNFDETSGRKTDLIITTATGSYWYYSTGASWNNVYTRTDLPLGSVSFKVADFDGDVKSDMIISTPSGSYWYYSTGVHNEGNWNTGYTRTDLPLYKARFVTGDFNGGATKRSDVIITTALGSYWYYATAVRGTWDTTYQRADLPL